MLTDLKELEEKAMRLPPQQRAELAEQEMRNAHLGRRLGYGKGTESKRGDRTAGGAWLPIS